MENYFILLELPFDLPESDTNKISEAISKKQAQWSRDQSNPVKKAKASEYLAALEDIKKVMLDPTARKQEAAKAKQIKASKAKELEAKLSLYRAKGDELSEKDLKRLVKVFGAFGFTADEIKKKFGSGNKKQDKIDPSEVLDKTQARNVQNFMQQLDMKEKTLYDFLSLSKLLVKQEITYKGGEILWQVNSCALDALNYRASIVLSIFAPIQALLLNASTQSTECLSILQMPKSRCAKNVDNLL